MRISYALLALLLVAPLAATAQESSAIRAARAHFQTTQAASLAASDLADLHAIDQHRDRRSGAEMVYLIQRHAGIPVYGSVSAAAVMPSGKVIAVRPAFQEGLVARTNATAPSVSAEAAVARAQQHVSDLWPVVGDGPVTLSDDPATDNRPRMPRMAAYEITTPELVYQATPSGEMRLAWSMTLSTETGLAELWAVRVDALSGQVLAADDLVARHAFTPKHDHAELEVPSFAPLAAPAAQPLASLGGPTYRVLPWPNESPSHGALALVSAPHNPTASPQGWHNTGSVSFTITRGNNVWAYEDRNDTNGPSAVASSPDGGAGLAFDFPFDPALSPADNVNSAVTNLFYWNNVIHDVTHFYGFDEASGNFQATNFSGQGAGGDPVRAEAQDKAGLDPCPTGIQCTNNANFSTPADGGSGRMQMYEWNAPALFEVTAPASIAGLYPTGAALFGVQEGSVAGRAVVVRGANAAALRGCTAGVITNQAAISGNIMLVERGDCNFIDKARVGQALGATAVVVYNCEFEALGCSSEGDDQIINMALPEGQVDDVTVIARFITRSAGVAIVNAEQSETVTLTMDLSRVARDSDMDAGVILHEYAHGISNRLTGGRTQAGCLANQEQAGEGWSDYYGLMLTMKPTDTAAQPRGIASYLEFEPIDGPGIRPARYSTDFAVNDYTYQDVITGAGGAGPRSLSVPHGLGFVWSSMIWDMTWDLIAVHGFDADIYNAAGTAGNQIALNLVTMGLKLQPCSPGFVDARDAILAADVALYGGANQLTIWTAFARRGLGANASQGASTVTSDGVADFTVPVIATEQTATGGTVSLTVAGPNPFTARTAVALALDTEQEVRVELFDLLGRRVATLHDGALAAGVPHRIEVGAADLPSGAYVVRATGDTFSISERITVAR
jgi:hypothetical protein